MLAEAPLLLQQLLEGLVHTQAVCLAVDADLHLPPVLLPFAVNEEAEDQQEHKAETDGRIEQGPPRPLLSLTPLLRLLARPGPLHTGLLPGPALLHSSHPGHTPYPFPCFAPPILGRASWGIQAQITKISLTISSQMTRNMTVAVHVAEASVTVALVSSAAAWSGALAPASGAVPWESLVRVSRGRSRSPRSPRPKA